MLWIYRLLFPLVCVVLAPFWLIKMIRRGGWGSGLIERIGVYDRPVETEDKNGVYIHAVSVGEVLLAIRLIKRWQELHPNEIFVLAPTTATGMAVARTSAPAEVRIIYAPLDFAFLIQRLLDRFSPRVIILIESELWPNLLSVADAANIPVGIANARLSPRSEHRLDKFQPFIDRFLSTLKKVGVPEPGDIDRWANLGVPRRAIMVTRNLKFDTPGTSLPRKRAHFAEILERYNPKGLPVALAASTFSGEEPLLARAFAKAGCFPLIVPRHAERRAEVLHALDSDGQVRPILRSVMPDLQPTKKEKPLALVVDTTGELRDWTAHADVVVIGKSLLPKGAKGGQNPGEAIAAGVPVIAGPYMKNFEPLITELENSDALLRAQGEAALIAAVKEALAKSDDLTTKAKAVLASHQGALDRTIALFA